MKLSHLLTSSTLLVALVAPLAHATDIAQGPLYTSRQVQPLNMLVMGRDHKLYNEAYNDASDLDGDSLLDVRFKPSITYFGYFDPKKCYDFSSGVFVPKSVGTSGNWTDPVDNVSKAYVGRCVTSGSGEWSGNFLNYLTTSRIDALRKVLYGGKRSTDTATTGSGTGVTILERSSIPQDAHSWGKEYTSTAVDGYDIADYTPLSQPLSGRRHLFANTTLGASTTTSSGDPLLRVLENAAYRIWEWVSIEQPVAGDKCLNGGSGPSCTAGGTDTSHPNNSAEFAALIQRVSAVSSNLVSDANGLSRNYIYKDKNGRRYVGSTTYNGTGTTTSTDDDNYVSVLKGTLKIATTGSYTFFVNGDDAVEVLIDGVSVAGYYGGHSVSGTACDAAHSGTVNLTAGDHTIEFRHEEVNGSDLYNLTWNGPGITGCAVVPYNKATTNSPAYGPDKSATSLLSPRFENLKLYVYTRTLPTPVRTDYAVRNQVCVAGLLEDNCSVYSSTSGQTTRLTYKPVGLLQDYGVSASSTTDPKMRFGLLTGSYTKNLSGGVLRRTVTNISDEVDAGSGVFTSVNGIIRTIDKLKLVGFNGSEYNSNCGRISTRELRSGECRMWGNPIAEMMYEASRYFAGKAVATSAFTYTNNTGDDYALGLPVATWNDPYKQTGVRSCSTPVQTVISDINPSYDTDELPGSYWQASGFTSDMTGLDVGKLSNTIWNGEFGASAKKLIFIGEAGGVKDGAPSAKEATTFRTTRGLAPEEPTKYGGYYAAAIAYYGRQTALNAASSQKMSTFSVALASPLPQVKIPVGGREVTLVPFAKSVGGNSISAAKADYQPTNAIVDFYVESIAADRTSGTFRVNFEDTEQGADYDMDAIAKYSYQVNSNGTVTVNMSSDYAAGGIIQHMGYVISGTTTDGVFLEVRDVDTAQNDDVNYYLDTGTRVNNNIALPLASSRTFTPGTTGAAGLLKDPLWYAAKWGGFNDRNGTGTPDIPAEWTSAAASATDPDPDNYFLVTNALGLRAQLDKAFSDILASLSSSASAAASTGAFVPGTTQVVQARFRTSDWSGELVGYQLLSTGAIGQIIWNAANEIPAPASRKLYTLNPAATAAPRGVPFLWTNLTTAQQTALAGSPTATSAVAQARLNYLRGDQSKEVRYSGGIFRNRTNGVLGDIINSNPQYVGGDTRLKVIPSAYSASYETFRTGLSSRPDTVYAGGNDGMLHGFCADNCGSSRTKGQELLGYIPNFLMSNLYLLTQPDYTHRYYVDGVPKASDVRIGSAWKTVVVGSAGAGGKGLFALDVTDPRDFDGTKVLWEFTPASETAAGLATQDLGYFIGSPVITMVRGNSNSVAIFSSGIDGSSGRTSVYVVDIATGAVVRRIQLPSSAGTSVSAPTVLDSDNDGYTDYVYLGDSSGQLWRVDLTDNSATNWNVGLNGNPLLIARNLSGDVQPMTAAPLVGTPDTEGNVMVYIGTGRYLGTTDKTDSTVQAFYGVKDKWLKGSNGFTSRTRANLQEQTIVTEAAAGSLVGTNRVQFAYRITSANEVDPALDGWYLTLTSPNSPRIRGERVTTQAQISGNKVIFTTTIPPVDSCEFGGSSWLMEVNVATGKRFDTAIFDTNGDGYVDDRDAAVNGRGWDELITPPALINECPNGTVCKVSSGSSGNLSMVLNNGDTTLPKGRISWRQLE